MDREYLLVIELKKSFFESTRRIDDLLPVAVIVGLQVWIDAVIAGSEPR